MSQFKVPFQLEFIFKTTAGAVFQALIVAAILIEHWDSVSTESVTLISLMTVFVSQVYRYCLYLWARSSEKKLLEYYRHFTIASCFSALGWGMACGWSLMLKGSTGPGLSTLLCCATIGCATAYVAATDLKVHRYFTAFILIPPAIGLILHSFPHVDWVTVGMLVIVAIYSVSLAKKQNANLQQIYEQQERIKMDLKAAREIQQSLLPKLNQEFGPFEIEVLYKPCEDLSGDFFEIQPHRNHLLFYVADVTSHGTASAQVTFLLKGIFKNILSQLDGEIDLEKMTRQLAVDYSSYGLTYSVSLFMGCLDMETGKLQFVSSNFPRPILIGGEKPKPVDVGINPVIDAMNSSADYKFKLDSVQVSQGLSLFVFTDGTYELQSPSNDGMLTYRQLSKVLGQNDKDNWKESVITQLGQLNGSEKFQDDITIMKIHHRKLSAEKAS